MIRADGGPFVRFEDYAKLEAEAARQEAVIARQACQLAEGSPLVDHYCPKN